MNKLFFTLVLFFPFILSAQNVSGIYAPIKNSGDPQGGSIFFVTEDNHWGAMAFGTAVYGTVEKISDSFYKFEELKPRSPFSVYTKQNKKLMDSSRLYFSGFTEGAYVIHFDKEKTKLPETYDVYNLGASCFSYPALSILSGIKQNLALAAYGWTNDRYDKNKDAYSFYNYCNKKKHNDIAILNHTEVFNKKETMMVITDSFLYEPRNPQRGYKKTTKHSESLEEMKAYLEQNIEYPKIIYLSNQFKQVNTHEFESGGWEYNKQDDCYSKISLEKAKSLEEKSDYNEPVILYPYRLIEKSTQHITEIKNLNKSLLNADCND